jgi:arabinogalactan endo-1,4-beta-galactosidase
MSLLPRSELAALQRRLVPSGMPARAPFWSVALPLFCVACLTGWSRAADFANGADVSWLPQMEAAGFRFLDRDGQPQDCLRTLQAEGIDTIRLRVWVNPSSDPRNGHCSRDEVAALARRVQRMGFRLLLDFHYSDTWADPAHQEKPAAWAGHSIDQLADDVARFTTSVLTTLKDAGVTPEWVQVGNEIRDGMLWPEGHTSEDDTSLARLINAGYDAVKAVDPQTKVIVHVDRGDDNGLFRRFFDHLQRAGGKFDVIGLSYYPNLSKLDTSRSLERLGENLDDLVARYGKEVMVVEVGASERESGKTRAMLSEVLRLVRAVRANKGLGVVYWEPEGAEKWSRYPLSAWQDDGHPSEALDAFRKAPAPASR